jgi:Kef-type K+ transport system membrane component KefB
MPDAKEQTAVPKPLNASSYLMLLLRYGGMLAIAAVLFFLIDTYGSKLPAALALPPEVRGPSLSGKSDVLRHVLLALFAVLVTGQLLAWVLRYLGQPAVIGEVLGGILLGPSFLGQLSPTAAEFVLPPDVAPYLSVIAQLGVILYMFLVGLELNPAVLHERFRSLLAITHGGTVVPFLLGAVLALYLYPRFSNSHVPFTSFALFISVALSITAFPVLARILTDRRMQKTRLGVLALGCAAMSDVIGWCLLAFVVGVAQAKISGAFLVLTLTAAYLGFMFLGVRPVVARLLRRGDEIPWTQGLVALIFAALLLSSLATETIGIHAIFGAFLLGAVIPHDNPIAVEMTQKLEDLVTVLLLPSFFALTGMRTQIGLVAGSEEWFACALIILAATIGKFGGTLLGARMGAGFSWRDALGLGILMNTRGLMELIVLNIGMDLHLLSPTLFTMMVLMSLATTLATTPLLHWFERSSEKLQQGRVSGSS